MLLQLQQDKTRTRQELEMNHKKKQAYENESFEGNEMEQEPESTPCKAESNPGTEKCVNYF